MSDSFRHAAKVSDEQVLFLREQLTAAHAAIEREQAERRAEKAGYVAEIAHLRQGIAAYGNVREGDPGSWRTLADWLDRDRNRAEGRQLDLGTDGK